MNTRKTAEDIDTDISDLIGRKIAAEDADSGWAVAWAAMRVLPVLKQVVEGLDRINEAIAPDNEESPSLAVEVRSVSDALKRMVKLAEEARQ